VVVPESSPIKGKVEAASSIFEDPRFQSNSVPVALDLMLTGLDRCRDLMQNVTPERAFSIRSGSFDKALTSREKRALDAELVPFWDDYKSKAYAELDKVMADTHPSETTNETYPLAPELAGNIAGILLQKIRNEVIKNHFEKYFTDALKMQYIGTSIRLGPDEESESSLGSALIPLTVSKLEEFLAALLRVALALHSNALGELPSIPPDIFKRYQTHISSADISRWHIGVISGPPAEWQASIKKRIGIDIAEVGGDWAQINEIIQRRHAITHNNGRVDDSYLAKVDSRLTVGLEPGSDLVCGKNYVLPALIELETWALCLAAYWAKHFFKKDAQYYPFTITRVVDLESQGRWTQAIAILEALLREPLPSSYLAGIAQVNRWFCLQQVGGGSESLDREIATWKREPEDEADAFIDEVSRAALLRDYSELAKLIRRGIGSESLKFDKKYYREQPLIKRAMSESHEVARLLYGSTARTRAPSRPRSQSRAKRRHLRRPGYRFAANAASQDSIH
jgi:hypothetical protein